MLKCRNFEIQWWWCIQVVILFHQVRIIWWIQWIIITNKNHQLWQVEHRKERTKICRMFDYFSLFSLCLSLSLSITGVRISSILILHLGILMSSFVRIYYLRLFFFFNMFCSSRKEINAKDHIQLESSQIKRTFRVARFSLSSLAWCIWLSCHYLFLRVCVSVFATHWSLNVLVFLQSFSLLSRVFSLNVHDT